MQYKLLISFLLIIISLSCNRNKLKTKESDLREQILSEEEQEERKRIEREKSLALQLDTLPKGFLFAEDRSVDDDCPPMLIDIAKNLDSVKVMKLSDVASEISYIRMQPLPDSTISTDMKYKYYLMKDHIVAMDIFGIHLFDLNGHFKKTVVKNIMSGVSYNKERDRIHILYSDFSKIGGSTDVWARGNDLFYNYKNTITGQRYIMEYNCSEELADDFVNKSFDPEAPNKILGSGKISVDLNYGREPTPQKRRSRGARSMDSDYQYRQMSTFSPDKNTTVYFLGGKSMLGIYRNDGNKLASFTKYEQVENYSKRTARGTDRGTKYMINGNLFFRSEFNDTIFQVIPPNRILPKYVLNLGQYKMTKLEGMDPEISLQGKIVPMSWADTRNHIFLKYAKDNYSCPNTRKSKSVKIYHAIFSKNENKLSVLEGDPTNYEPNILENDLDGGVPVWPASYMIGNKGEILVSLKGSELKEHIKSENLKNSSASQSKKTALKTLAKSVTNDESILMIVK